VLRGPSLVAANPHTGTKRFPPPEKKTIGLRSPTCGDLLFRKTNPKTGTYLLKLVSKQAKFGKSVRFERKTDANREKEENS